MRDAELVRYSRQILLPEVDIAGQQKLLDSHVLVIGCGGLGCPASMYLAASGVGELTLVDFDSVEVSNLQRQIAHLESDVGRNKAVSAAESLRSLNPATRVSAIERKLTSDELSRQVLASDLVIDATDNFRSRHEINGACVRSNTPLVSGAAIRMEGQVAAFDARSETSPCYRCLHDDQGELDQNCSERGVLSPIVGVIGTIQAMEAIKMLAGIGDGLVGYVLAIDGRRMEVRKLRLYRQPTCPVCSGQS
ncbi:MAG: molybdopterin-synthase adenylyltransferase MoeB [Pseudomonadales bacterium]|nr:molybdopterin-synthase adenylyltransferase MoeB [Pseudomonadales bacterium]